PAFRSWPTEMPVKLISRPFGPTVRFLSTVPEAMQNAPAGTVRLSVVPENVEFMQVVLAVGTAGAAPATTVISLSANLRTVLQCARSALPPGIVTLLNSALNRSPLIFVA